MSQGPSEGTFTQWLLTQIGPAEAGGGDTAQKAGQGHGLVERTAGGGDQLVYPIPEVRGYPRRGTLRELG